MSLIPIQNRKAYSSELKEKVIKESGIYGCQVTAEKYGVSLPTVYKWRSMVHKRNREQVNENNKIMLTVDRTLEEINKALQDGPGDSKPHEWLGKLTVQVEKLVQLHQSMSGLPGRITEERVIHHATVDDRISRYLEAINTKRDYIDTTASDS